MFCTTGSNVYSHPFASMAAVSSVRSCWPATLSECEMRQSSVVTAVAIPCSSSVILIKEIKC